jgi:hypothetical protein
MSGFVFQETMSGAVRLLGEGRERAMSFSVGARSRPWESFLRRREVEIEGEIDVEGFADHRHLRGTLGMDLLRTATLPYAFEFVANDGARYAFAGTKKVRLDALVHTMTVLPGEVRDAAGALVGEALLRFDVRSDLGRFLRSFRLDRR